MTGRVHDSRFDTVIALDGPSGVGKSTVSRLVARRLGFVFVNTGDMYRALTWKALEEGVSIRNPKSVVRFLNKKMDWKFHVHEGVLKIRLDGRELGRELRSERVSLATPIVARIPQVRLCLRALQRQAAMAGRAVLEGRDTTTHVVPKAGTKIFLDAPVEERAKRRYHQHLSDGKRVKFESIKKAVETRDAREINMNIMPKRRSPGTIVLDTSHLALHEVADQILKLYWRHHRGRRTS
ncbi:MAG: (d)CMP kinase [Elusimicrobiota bacterium]